MNKRHQGGSRTQYSAATMSFYGPDDRHATKVVVGIVKSKTSDPAPLRRWKSEKNDVRRDQNIGQEILAFLKMHNVKTVVATDRIIGCPHEEGKDYPEGTKCACCSFWANRDWWTGEIEK
jgi:hypothetical protein